MCLTNLISDPSNRFQFQFGYQFTEITSCKFANITQYVDLTSVIECGIICKYTPECYSFGYQPLAGSDDTHNGT